MHHSCTFYFSFVTFRRNCPQQNRTINSNSLRRYIANRKRLDSIQSPKNNYFAQGKLTSRLEAMRHKIVTDVVHEKGGKIAMQILHAGR